MADGALFDFQTAMVLREVAEQWNAGERFQQRPKKFKRPPRNTGSGAQVVAYGATLAGNIAAGTPASPTMGTGSVYSYSAGVGGVISGTLLPGTKEIGNPYASALPAGGTYAVDRVAGSVESYVIAGIDVMRLLASYPGFGEKTVPYMKPGTSDIEQLEWGGAECPTTVQEENSSTNDVGLTTAWMALGPQITIPRDVVSGELVYSNLVIYGQNTGNQAGNIGVGVSINGATPQIWEVETITASFQGRRRTDFVSRTDLAAASGSTFGLYGRIEQATGGFNFTVQGSIVPSKLEYGTG